MKRGKNVLIRSIFNRNKILSLIPILILSLFFIPFINALTPISNCAELQTISNSLSEDYYLTNDINCSGFDFIPIGEEDYEGGIIYYFSGTFEGNNFNISNLYVNTVESAGLFAFFNGTIKNVGLTNASITGGNHVGGLVGATLYGTVINSYVIGNIIGDNVVGGLVGMNEEGIIINSYVIGNIIGNYNDVGGLVGLNLGTINNSYVIGTVVGYYYVGGLIGENIGFIENSYSTGNVVGGIEVGGLVGYNLYGTVINSYYDNQTSGQNDTGKGEPKTTIEMMDLNTFSVWDIALIEEFTNEIWFINNTYDYPRLFYQYIEPDIEAPFYTDINYIGEIINQTTTFYCEWNDNNILEPNGYWIFSTNNSGSWINDSAINFTFTPQIAFVNKTLNEIPSVIGYKFYACDNEENCNETEIYTITSQECNIDEDCIEGYFCNLNGICELIEEEPTSISNILAQVGAGIIVIFVLFMVFIEIKGRVTKK